MRDVKSFYSRDANTGIPDEMRSVRKIINDRIAVQRELRNFHFFQIVEKIQVGYLRKKIDFNWIVTKNLVAQKKL